LSLTERRALLNVISELSASVVQAYQWMAALSPPMWWLNAD